MTQDQHPLLPKVVLRKDKDVFTRVNTFLEYEEQQGKDWRKPDLNEYRDYLLNEKGFEPTTVVSYVSAVKRQYRRILKERTEPFEPAELEAIRAAIDIHAGQLEYSREIEVEHLTQNEIEMLLTLPDIKTNMGLRDTLIMALILFTGISDTEICSLKVEDLLDREEGLYLKLPKREVLVSETMFYDEPWVSSYISHWIMRTGIREGILFRGFYRGGNVVRKNKLNPNAIHEIVRRYTEHERGMEKFTILDLRRTYARRLYDNGVDIDTIRERLGYNSNQTVISYIGLPDREGRLGSHERGRGQAMLNRLNTRKIF